MFKKLLLCIMFITSLIMAKEKPKTIEFYSADSLKISADLYIQNEDKTTPFIILFHQAGWSRGEYIEIAPKLNNLGFNCMAIDQRSGRGVNNIENETHKRAKQANLSTDYVDAYSDLESAIDYVKSNFSDGKLIIWGSSYSSALVLHIAGQRKDLDAVMSFSPGEYFEKQGKPADWIVSSAKNIDIPVFITSAKDEKHYWENIYSQIKSKNKVGFLPETDGNHGSRALWSVFEDNDAYWNAVKTFLKQID